MEMGDWASCLVLGIQILRNPHVVILNDGVGSIEDGSSRPVVLSHDDVGLRSAFKEFFKTCSSPFVDVLVRVSHHEQVAVAGAQYLIYLPVAGVAVLHLVDHHIVHLPLPLCPDIWKVVENMQCE